MTIKDGPQSLSFFLLGESSRCEDSHGRECCMDRGEEALDSGELSELTIGRRFLNIGDGL